MPTPLLQLESRAAPRRIGRKIRRNRCIERRPSPNYVGRLFRFWDVFYGTGTGPVKTRRNLLTGISERSAAGDCAVPLTVSAFQKRNLLRIT